MERDNTLITKVLMQALQNKQTTKLNTSSMKEVSKENHISTNSKSKSKSSDKLYEKALGGMLLSTATDLLMNQISKGIEQNNQNQQIENNINKVSNDLNPYGLKYGGKIKGSKDNFEYGGDMSHAKGGIPVSKDGLQSTNPVAEVESKETSVKIDGESYIFSTTLKI